MNDKHSGHWNAALWLTGSGALLGGFLALVFAPRFIAWYFRPPGQTISCTEPVEWALSRMQSAQFFGVMAGAIIGIALYFAIYRRHRTPKPVTA